MATATVVDRAPMYPHNRPNLVSVGTIVWLSSELMFFSALFAMYFTVKAVNPVWPPGSVELDLKTALPFTIVLIASSVTCQWGVFAAEKGDVHKLRRWYVITLIMGAIFVLGQSYEYFVHNQHLETPLTLSSSAYGSVYYITTGFHGLHVAGGLVAFVFVLARTYYGRFSTDHATSAIVVSYYWHFVDVVWIALFTTIYIIR